MTASCLVTGGTGALGPAVVRAFVDRQYRVRAFARRQPPPDLFDPSVEFVSGDISVEHEVARAVEGVDVVVHLAALLHVLEPAPSLREEYERVNIGGTKTLVRACEAAGVRRIVYFSTIAVYGDSNGGVLTETTDPAPETWYARTKLDAENLVLGATDGEQHPIGTVLRLAAVYGPRVKGNYGRLIRGLRLRRFVPLGAGQNRRALIHEKDVARAALLAAEHPTAAGQVFNVSDGASPPVAEIIGSICDALDRPRPRLTFPLTPVRWAVNLVSRAASWIGVRLPIGPATIDKYVEDVVVDSSKIRERLGFVPQFDQRAGWRDAIGSFSRDVD